MDREQALAKIQDVVSKQLGVEKDRVLESASFTDDLGADSLDLVELIMAFEEEFDVQIPDEEAEKLQTIGDSITYLLDRTNEEQA